MASAEPIHVEVVYALPEQQVVKSLTLTGGTTVQDAITRSGLLQQFPEIDLSQQRVGIFGRLASLKDVLKANDRVEIYRPLARDPKHARRELAKAGKTMGHNRRG
jgi:putative ubiquitin-RnfH superfamily antitoxin RatB of RatAB toxin-antitoxin module